MMGTFLSETNLVIEILSGFSPIKNLLDENNRRDSLRPNANNGHSYSRDERLNQIITLLRGQSLSNIKGYFINHRISSEYSTLDDEYKIQDLIYCLVSPFVDDLHYESPQSKNRGALTSTRVDFSSKKLSLFLEVKHANSKHNAQKIEKEIGEDIQKYGKSKQFKDLIFFVYCHDYSFPNSNEFEIGNTHTMSIGEHTFNTSCIVYN